MKIDYSYKRDKYLYNIDCGKYKNIIINIQNVLLLSKSNKHSDIYYFVGEELCEKYNFNYSPEIFKNIRLEAEKKILLCDTSYSLKKIYSYIPFSKKIIKEAYKIELKKEYENTIINYSVFDFILDNKEKIILTSNSYLSMEELDKIIKHVFGKDILNIPLIPFNECKKILNKHYLYIDNSSKNINSLKQFSCEKILYGTENNIFDKYSFEENYLGSSVRELYFIRELASYQSAMEKTPEDAFFFEVGASSLAPVYALFAEWIISFCKKNKIKCILPLMREGTVISAFITELLKDNSIECKPLYVSRRALFNASITLDNFDQKINSVVMKQQANPNILLSDIGLSLKKTPFIKYNKIKDLISDDKLDDLLDYIYKNKNVILEYSKNQRSLFLEMLSNLCGNKKSVTVDIGFSGTSEGYIRDLIKYDNSKINIEHIILMGSDGAQIKNIMNGLKIYSLLGMAGENSDITKKLMYQIQILEVLINDVCGTTMKYEKKDNIVKPVLDTELPKNINENNNKALASQRGMYTFISLWLKYRDNINIEKLFNNKLGFINMWRKLIECPQEEEAYYLGKIMLYDNYTIEKKLYNVRNNINKDIEDIDEFLQDINKNISEYPQAIVACRYPNYYKEKLIYMTFKIPGIKKMISIINKIKNSDNGNIAIFAAGQRGRDFLKVARLLGLDINCFIDSNIALCGTIIDGIPVISIEDANKIKYFVNSSYNYPNQVNCIILKNYGDKNIKIFTI